MGKSLQVLARSSRSLTALAVCLSCSQASAELRLDALRACSEIAALIQSMRSPSPVFASDCRSANEALERAIDQRLGPDARLCVVRSPPAPFLNGYSCVTIPAKLGATLDCVRRAELLEVAAFKQEFREKGSSRAIEYMEVASKCEVTNANTTVAPPTTFSPLLAVIAKPEIAFVSPIGKGRQTDSYIQHGFASTDPTISGNAPAAIEFVSILVGGATYSPNEEKRQIGDWIVRTDRAKEMNSALNEFYKKNNVPAFADGALYTLQNTGNSPTTQSAKIAFLRRLQAAIVRGLEVEGFEDMPDSEFVAKAGKSRADFGAAMVNNMPYGRRHWLTGDAPGYIHILFNTSRPACTETGGVFATYLMSINPLPDVETDFGSLIVMTAGIGRCSRTTLSSTKTYMDGIAKLTRGRLLAQLNSK